MDAVLFDRVTSQLGRLVSRRATIGGLGLAALILPGLVDAKKRKRKKQKRKKQKPLIKFNDYGCVNVGAFCQNSEQCCSGICTGKQGKKRCQAHDGGSGCQAGQAEGCAAVSGNCTTSTGLEGGCDTTTGNAGYCGYGFACADCHKDADCQELCGLAAAVCITCPDCDGTSTFQTACVGPGPGDCQQGPPS
jgi:hypothetical protein